VRRRGAAAKTKHRLRVEKLGRGLHSAKIHKDVKPPANTFKARKYRQRGTGARRIACDNGNVHTVEASPEKVSVLSGRVGINRTVIQKEWTEL